MQVMQAQILAQRWSWVLVLAGLGAGLIWLTGQLQIMGTQPHDGRLTIHVLDVGQGSATLIETPEGQQILIDGGAGPMILRALSRQLPWYDRTLDMVVATHPDTDHVGGLVDVLRRYRVAHIVWNGQSGDGPAAQTFGDMVDTQTDAVAHLATAGQRWQVGASTTLEVYAPAYRPEQIPTNAGSVVLRVVYGDTSMLLPGDVPKAVERYLVTQYSSQLVSTVLQLGHHGSDTSTDPLFLRTVQPSVAVVSAGTGNSYGHPASEVVARVQDYGVPLFNTASDGTITLVSDGQRVWRTP